MILVLVGYRGTGKSHVGRILAERLRMPYIGMDAEIVSRAGMPITEIVENFGWARFRDMESELVRELSVRDNIVVDTGGGVVERPENIEVLKQNACIVWLRASVDTIVSRIQSCTARPSLTSGKSFTEEVAEVLERRTPLYQSAAHHEVDTDRLTPEQIVDRVITYWTTHLAKR